MTYETKTSILCPVICLVAYLIVLLFLSGCGACNKNFCWTSRDEMSKVLANSRKLCDKKLEKAKNESRRLLQKVTELEVTLEIKENVLANRQFIIEKGVKAQTELREKVKILSKKAEEKATEVYNQYIVKQGDWLSKIADFFYKRVDFWGIIWKANQGIKNPNLIFPGQELIIPMNITKEKKQEAIELHSNWDTLTVWTKKGTVTLKTK